MMMTLDFLRSYDIHLSRVSTTELLGPEFLLSAHLLSVAKTSSRVSTLPRQTHCPSNSHYFTI